jgi:cell division protein FtsL
MRAPEPARRVILNERLVKDRDQARARELQRVVWVCAAMLVPVLFYVWQQVEYIRYGYQVEQLRSEKSRLVEWNRQLKLERATLLNLRRVEKVAAGQLGLVPPTSENTVKIRLSGETGTTQDVARGKEPVEGLAAAER